jgi:large subunit ribosomal protein L21
VKLGKPQNGGYTARPFLKEIAVYAIIEDRGSQMKVSQGDVLDIDLLSSDEKDKKSRKLSFDRVLMISDAESDKAAKIGAPYLNGVSVDAEVLEEVRGEKLDVIMYKRRKGQRRKIGHRQSYTRIKITKINA